MKKSILTCFVCGERMASSRGSLPQGKAAHHACRRSVQPHGVSQYRRGCRCDVCREAQRLDQREYNRKRRERDGVSATAQSQRKRRGVDPLAPTVCGYCGDPVGSYRGSGVTYHRDCRFKVPLWKREGRESPKVRAFRKRIAKAAEGTRGARVFICGACEWCGKYVVSQGRFCSDSCSAGAANARRTNKFKISPRKRLEIYERDGWVCQLCFYPVDPSAPTHTIWSATLDHIVPQSVMLIPDHSPSNLRLAHLWCNSARGDGANMAHEIFMRRVKEMRLGLAA